MEYKDKAQRAAEEKAMLMEEADAHFSRIDPKVSNGQLLLQAVNAPKVSSFIVERLEDIERTGELFGNDKALASWFDRQIQSGAIVAPEDPVDKHRWLALLCIAASKKEDFSYGNVVLAPDYLPEDSEAFQEYESVYGAGVMDDILAKRQSLK